MQLLIYAFATVFIFMAVVMVLTYQTLPQRGVLLLGFVYGVSAVAALSLMQAWPLFAGFVTVCVLRMFGFDPKPKMRDAPEAPAEGETQPPDNNEKP
jgi:hypothetical protein